MIVKLIYQPYRKDMAIFIDDQPIGTITTLSRYQSQPFQTWCSVILPTLAAEVNDDYDLVYIGQKSEFEVLKQFMLSCPACRSISYQAPEIADSTLVRLKKLSRIAQNGITVNRFSYLLHVYTDLDCSMVQGTIQSILPKLSFCRIIYSVHPISNIRAEQNPPQALAVLGGESVILREVACYASNIVAATENAPKVINASMILPMKDSTLAECLERLLEINVYPDILLKALSTCSVPENSPYYSEFFMLDKVEPQTIVRLPKSIEYGESIPILVTTIPKGSKIPQIKCRVSNDAVIEYQNGYLKAVGTGEAVVEIYEAGKTVTLKTGTITAYRRNRIQSLLIQPKDAKMCVGERLDISYSYAPVDSDNVSSIRLVSRDGTVVSPQGKMSIVARSPGRCSILYEAEKVKSDVCDIAVYPTLEKLEIVADETMTRINNMTKVNVRRFPSDATLDKLSFRVEPSSLGTFDVGSGCFFARQVGKGRIIVQSDRNGVQAMTPIEVKANPLLNVKTLLITSAIGLAILIAWYFLR